MATVNAVHQNDNSMLSNVVKGVATGAGIGYISKYMLPVQAGEKETREYKKAMEIIKRETGNIKGVMIERIRNLPNKTPAQDTFIKVTETAKGSIPEKLKLINTLGAEDKLELRNIISTVNDYASKMLKRHITAYEIGVTKRIRPAFVGLGAFLGFAGAVAYNVAKTNVKNA